MRATKAHKTVMRTMMKPIGGVINGARALAIPLREVESSKQSR